MLQTILNNMNEQFAKQNKKTRKKSIYAKSIKY